MTKLNRSGSAVSALITLALLLGAPARPATQVASPNRNGPARVHALKITILSTMLVGEPRGLGEWGFPGLVEADGHRILVDTGSHPETVLQNARKLNLDLSDVREVILTHYHWDHVRGLMTLRKEMMKTGQKFFPAPG